MQVTRHLPPVAHSTDADSQPQDFFADTYSDSDSSADASSLPTLGDGTLATSQQDIDDGDDDSALQDIADAYASGAISKDQALQMMSMLGMDAGQTGSGASNTGNGNGTVAQNAVLPTVPQGHGGHR